MIKLETIFENSKGMRGKCPKTGETENMKYRGRVTIGNPKMNIKYRVQCFGCGGIHEISEVKDLEIDYKED